MHLREYAHCAPLHNSYSIHENSIPFLRHDLAAAHFTLLSLLNRETCQMFGCLSLKKPHYSGRISHECASSGRESHGRAPHGRVPHDGRVPRRRASHGCVPQTCISQMRTSWACHGRATGVHLIGVYLTGMHLICVHLMGGCLMGVYLLSCISLAYTS